MLNLRTSRGQSRVPNQIPGSIGIEFNFSFPLNYSEAHSFEWVQTQRDYRFVIRTVQSLSASKLSPVSDFDLSGLATVAATVVLALLISFLMIMHLIVVQCSLQRTLAKQDEI
jgi:hypothetical protein